MARGRKSGKKTGKRRVKRFIGPIERKRPRYGPRRQNKWLAYVRNVCAPSFKAGVQG